MGFDLREVYFVVHKVIQYLWDTYILKLIWTDLWVLLGRWNIGHNQRYNSTYMEVKGPNQRYNWTYMDVKGPNERYNWTYTNVKGHNQGYSSTYMDVKGSQLKSVLQTLHVNAMYSIPSLWTVLYQVLDNIVFCYFIICSMIVIFSIWPHAHTHFIALLHIRLFNCYSCKEAILIL